MCNAVVENVESGCDEECVDHATVPGTPPIKASFGKWSGILRFFLGAFLAAKGAAMENFGDNMGEGPLTLVSRSGLRPDSREWGPPDEYVQTFAGLMCRF